MTSAADSEHDPAADGAAGLGSGSGPRWPSGEATTPPAGSSQPSSGAAAPLAPASTGLVFDDPLDRASSDDTDRGWGDLPSGSADEDFARFLSEKPPHHL